jgi:hypothetical protein
VDTLLLMLMSELDCEPEKNALLENVSGMLLLLMTNVGGAVDVFIRLLPAFALLVGVFEPFLILNQNRIIYDTNK